MDRLAVAGSVVVAAVAVVAAAALGLRSTSRVDAHAAQPSPETRADVVRWVTFEGACDASGAVPVDERHFAVADDEDNVLRVYDALLGGKPVRKTNLSKQISLPKKGESDIEAATSVGRHAYWLSSHGRNASGEEDPNRSVVIVTDVPTLDEKVEVQGEVYRNLLADLLAAPELARYGLARAAELAPKAQGGLNIEGLTATPEGTLLIGFRNPVPGGKALILPLQNPDALRSNGAVKFGAPIELDLGGLGVRSLSSWRGSYLIAAGSFGEGGPARLYRWQGPGAAPKLAAEAAFAGANPEAFFTAESNSEILLLSDDGSRPIDGKACKKLKGKKGKKRKSFRGLWLRLPDLPS